MSDREIIEGDYRVKGEAEPPLIRSDFQWWNPFHYTWSVNWTGFAVVAACAVAAYLNR